MEQKEPLHISVIGAAIVDVLAYPVTQDLFGLGSLPMKDIRVSFGGDALNEAVILSRLGKPPELISQIGDDRAGEMVFQYIRKNGISTDSVSIETGLSTGVNIVLTDAAGERCFLTNPNGSLRSLGYMQLRPYLDNRSGIVSFASLFVSENLTILEMTEAFRHFKKNEGVTLCVDMTRAKHGETFDDIKPMLQYIDYIFPNETEITLLTGVSDAAENAGLLVASGVRCAVIKQGSGGCYVRTAENAYQVPAYPDADCVDTTGAGDTFAAGFIWALSEGYSLPECGRFACAAASCAIEALGAVDCVRFLDQVLERYNRMPEAVSLKVLPEKTAIYKCI